MSSMNQIQIHCMNKKKILYYLYIQLPHKTSERDLLQNPMPGLQWAEIQMFQVILDINICVTGPKASTQFSSTLCKEALLQRNEVIANLSDSR